MWFRFAAVVLACFYFVGCTPIPPADDTSVSSILQDRFDHQVHWNQDKCTNEYTHLLESLLSQDLTLDSAIQIALLNNAELQAIFEEIGISRADMIQAGLFQNPAFNIAFRFPDRSHLKTDIEFSLVGAFLDVLLIPLRQNVAQAQWEQTQIRVANAALDLAFDVEKYYYKIQAAQAETQGLKSLAELAGIMHQLAQKQYEVGNISLLALEEKTEQHLQAEIALLQTKVDLVDLQEQLTRRLGLCNSNQWKISAALADLPELEFNPACLDEIALSERLDVQWAKWEIYGMELLYPLRNWWTYTNALVGVSGEREPEGYTIAGPALSLALPFFNFGQADRARLCAMYQQAQDRLTNLQTVALSELHEAAQHVIDNRKIAQLYKDRLLPLQAKMLEIAQSYYNAMATSVFGLLEMKQHEVQAQVDTAFALRDYWLSRVDLNQAVDGKLYLAEKIAYEPPQFDLTPPSPPSFAHKTEHPNDKTPSQLHYTPVTTPNGATLPWKTENGVKVFHLIAEPIQREFAPGMFVNCWGYNGLTPGPTIEAVEGDRVRIMVTNRLPEPTTVHWHGVLLPNGMDGVTGLNQPAIPPGETFCYEFTLHQSGTCMYHPHFDEMTQIALGMSGFFIIHPRDSEYEKVDRDFAIMLHEWFVPVGASTPEPTAMDFNYFTFNSTVWPGTHPLVVKKGERVRIRFGNLSMDSHPIHLHGYQFLITRTGAERLPAAAQQSAVTVNVAVGDTRDIEFIANASGDWAMHCHKSHHTMSGMVHGLPNVLNVDQTSLLEKIRKYIPHYMPMGKNGMGEMFSMHAHGGPHNYLKHGSPGQFGSIEMSGMFTVLKVRDKLDSYTDPGWYRNPPGTVASPCK